MKNAIVKLGFCLLFLFAGYGAFAAPPTVAITKITTSPTNAASIDFDVLFSEDVTGFTNSDVTLAGVSGTSAAVTTISPSHYKITVTGHTTAGNVTVSIPASSVTAVAAPNDPNAVSNVETTVFDNVKPTVTVNVAASQSDPTSASPFVFAIVFSEPIDPATLTNADVKTTGSTTGGTLTVTGINEVAPMDKTKYEVTISLTGGASGNVLASINAGDVSDVAGNTNTASTSTDNSVAYTVATKPTLTRPTYSGIGETTVTLNGNITSAGSASVTARGFYYAKNKPSVDNTDTQVTSGSGTGTFNENITGLTAASHYYAIAYGTNTAGTAYSTVREFWTLATQPTSAPTATMTITGSTIKLNFPKANTINADGYVILRTTGPKPDIGNTPDGIHPDSLIAANGFPLAGTTIAGKVGSNIDEFTDPASLSACTDYYYVAVAYHWDGTNPRTTNYRYGSATEYTGDVHGVTWCSTSTITRNGTAAQLDYASRTAANITGTGDGLLVLSLKLRDGGASGDNDNVKTELASIKIKIDHPEYLKKIAYIDGSYVQAQNPANIVEFILPSNTTVTPSDDGNKDFGIYATFQTGAVIDDQLPIKFEVEEAIARLGSNGAGSGFVDAKAGNANVTSTIDVIATKVNIVSSGSPGNPNVNLGLTASVIDDFNHIDKNNTGSITISKVTGSGTMAIGDGATHNLAPTGMYAWTQLKFDQAGTKNLKIDHNGSVTDATFDFEIVSLGAAITGPSKTFCFNTTATTPSTFDTYGSIVVSEQDGSDFATGNGQTFSLILPDGFIFDLASTPTVTSSGPQIGTSAAFDSWSGNNIVRIKYNVIASGGTVMDKFIINNLKIKYTKAVAVTDAPILRIGGSAIIAGDSDSEAIPKIHGKLSAPSAGTLAVQFRNVVGSGVTADQTNFSNATAGGIALEAIQTSNSQVLTYPDAKFEGDGVVLNGSTYKFYPSTVADGDHDITLYYSDPLNAGCVSTFKKTYSVFSTVITGLNLTYCANDPGTALGNPTRTPPTGQCLNSSLVLVNQYTASNHHYYYYQLSYISFPPFGTFPTLNPVPLPNPNFFDPKLPEFADEIAEYGGIYVEAYYVNNCTGADDYYAGLAFVTILRPSPVTIDNVYKYGVCSTEADKVMSSPSYSSTNGVDEFWSTVHNGTGAAAGISGNRTIGFTFSPLTANPTSSDVTIDLHFKHKDAGTGCVVEAVQPVDVWGKPNQMGAGDLTNTAFPNATNQQYCLSDGNLGQFTVASNGVIHTWKSIIGTIAHEDETDNFKPDKGDFDIGVAAGAKAKFELRQVKHRAANRLDFFGCSSDPYVVTVDIKKPTTVVLDPKGLVCKGAPLDLTTLHADITSPITTIDGQWTTSTPVGNAGKFTDINHNAVTNFEDAAFYEPTTYEFLTAKQFTLTLKSDNPGLPCPADSKQVIVDVSPGVSLDFTGAVADKLNKCAGDEIPIDVALSDKVDSFLWTKVGGGTFQTGTDNSNTKAIYIPSVTEKDNGGLVKFTVTTADPDGSGPCPIVSKSVDVTIQQRPLIDVVPTIKACTDKDQLLTIPLDAPKTAGLSSATTWVWTVVSSTKAFAGTVSNPNVQTTTYVPSSAPSSNPQYLDYENPGLVSDLHPATVVLNVKAYAPAGNVCDAQSKDIVVNITGTPNTPKNVDLSYCVGASIKPLDATDNFVGPSWYKNIAGPGAPPVHAPSRFASTTAVSTGTVNTAELKEYYFLTQTFDGCESDFAQYTISVNPLPVPAYDEANQCFNETMQFTSTSTIAPRAWNDDPNGPRKIVTYQWTFGDGVSTLPGDGATPLTGLGVNTSGTYLQPGHKYAQVGSYNTRLVVTTNDNCSNIPVDKPVKVGSIPAAFFAFDKQCDQDNTVFTTTSSLPVDEETGSIYTWDFGDGNTLQNTNANAKAPVHKYAGVDTYTVSLNIETTLHCKNTVIKDVSIFPYINSFPYIEGFEGAHGWVTEGATTQSSWNLGTSAGAITSDPESQAGPKFWATHTNTGTDKVWYYDNERSVISGPCVNMSLLSRPVMALDYFNNTEKGADGAYIEFRRETDSNPKWEKLGDVSSGLNWYKESSVSGLSTLSGVGQSVSQYGWSGSTDGAWVTGRYNMDDFADDTKVRFRIVFGSNSSPVFTKEYDGFAFDYFKLETRNRLVLVENFTSKSASVAVTGNTKAFQDFPISSGSDEVVKIEYHTGLPAVAGDPTDPIFNQNPMDPNARASFYGLSAVPRGYIDGYTPVGAGGMFTDVIPGTQDKWADRYYSTESLKTSPLSIVIEDPTVTKGVMTIKGHVTANEFDILENKYSLYVAVVEETVGNDAYVLRKMLPSASGTKLPLTLKGGQYNFELNWSVDRAYLSDNPKLIAVAFVQSDIINADKERQVLQAAFNNNVPDVTSNSTTGLEVPFLEQTALYPNPADRLATIELPEATASGVEVVVFDQVGRQVHQGAIGIGQKSTTVDTSSLAGAVYIVQLRERGTVTTRKLLITHKQ